MKKVALSLLAFGLIGVAAFADDAPKVTIGEWGRQIYAVSGGKNAAGDTLTQGQLSASWGSAPRIVGLNIMADGGGAGFSITPSADSQGNFGLTDQNKAWIKPADGWTVESGWSLETDTWRGIHDFGNWNWLRFSFAHNDSVTFSRLGEGGYATAVEYNKDGLGGWASLTSKSDATSTNGTDPSTSFGAALQAGAAYTIKDIGQLKAQYLGNNVVGRNNKNLGSTSNGDQYGIYEVAFNLSAVKGLYEEIGFTIPSSANAGYVVQVADSLGYAVTDKATLNLQVIYADYNDKGTGGKAGTGLAGGVGVDYDLGDSVGISADIRYQNKLANNSGAAAAPTGGADADTIGFGVGLTKGFANGLIGVAFEYAGKGGFSAGGLSKTDAAWALPLRLEYWF